MFSLCGKTSIGRFLDSLHLENGWRTVFAAAMHNSINRCSPQITTLPSFQVPMMLKPLTWANSFAGGHCKMISQKFALFHCDELIPEV